MSRVIIKNFPTTFSQKQITKHFSKFGEVTDCKVLRNELGQSKRIAFLGFKKTDAGENAKSEFNGSFLGSSKITVEKVEGKKQVRNNQSEQQIRNKTQIKAPILAQKNKKYVQKALEIDQCRLYVTNLPYTADETQIRRSFQTFGKVISVKVPRGEGEANKGYAFVSFEREEETAHALSELNGKIVLGRYIRLQYAMEDVGQIIRKGRQMDYQLQRGSLPHLEDKSSYKRRKKREMRHKMHDTSNWNTLFLNPNTILQRMSSKLKLTKSQILLSQGLAAKMALAQTEVIEQTKQWMKTVGLDLQFLEKDRTLCDRSDKILLIKNLNYRCRQSQLKQLMGFYGVVSRIMLAPNRAVAIVEFENCTHAANALQKLQNAKFKNNFLYLEYAPISILGDNQMIIKRQQQQKIEDIKTRVIYLKNLNFQTTEESLRQFLTNCGQIKYAKIIKGKQGQSLGYGFAELSTEQAAKQAIKRLQNSLLDGHKIELSLSYKKDAALKKINTRTEDKSVEEIKGNKLIIKNLAFQAQKDDLKQLLNQYGCVSKIRIPRKMDGKHRGFAFVEFSSGEEAAAAKQLLGNSHIYGRKLVIQFEKRD